MKRFYLFLYFLFYHPWPKPLDYDPNDGQCRCGSHTHPGYICRRCGGEA